MRWGVGGGVGGGGRRGKGSGATLSAISFFIIIFPENRL